APLLPPVLLDVYMTLFNEGAVSLLRNLERAGYDLSASETPQYENMIRAEVLPANRGLPALFLRGIPDLLLRHRSGKRLIGELKWGARSVGKTPGAALASNEAQFCTYPELVRANGGGELPFRYMRLDAYASFGDPDELARRVKSFPVKGTIKKDNAVRTFGFRVEFQEAAANLEKIMPEVERLREGNFRILKDPSLQFGPCRHCSFTQICRRSNTETLLRAKQAERA
ncbi:MAG TPA: PD-(D/E)XK nuclease family protein, partial [Acidobacteriota bacterium]|nr:PD-(D/E)XK nuclease family protein [Acidobacteriota bacterium]